MWDSPNGSWNNVIAGSASITPTDMWMVGSFQSPVPSAAGDGNLNLAEHWDGSTWAMTTIGNPGQDGNDLSDVAAVATNDVWAVGTQTTNSFVSGEAAHWDGAFWHNTSFPSMQPFTSPFVLDDVVAFATNNVIAVGEYTTANLAGQNIRHTLILQWTGTGWSQMTSVDVGSGDNELIGIGGSSATDIWAVGYSHATPTSPAQSLIERFTSGPTWAVVTSPSLGGDNLLHVAADSTSSAWAVGYFRGSNGVAQALAVRWDGSTWTDNTSFNVPSVLGQYLASIVSVSATEYWAVGSYVNSTTSVQGPLQPFAVRWDGTNWSTTGFSLPSMIGTGIYDPAYTVAAPLSQDVWAGGQSIAAPKQLFRTAIQNFSGFAAPAITNVTAGDSSASVTWSPPCGTGGSPISSFVVTAHDGCTIQGSVSVPGPTPPTTVNYTGLPNGSPMSFTVVAVNALGNSPASAPSAVVTPTGAGKPNMITACSSRQYSLGGNNGSAWVDMDATNLSVSFTPAADSYAVLSGNVDLWTANKGFNQDVGISVTGGAYPTTAGQPQAWKESGGFAGTFSPNAAYVQTVIPVLASATYIAKLQWKANKPDSGTIFAGAGPIAGAFSPTRITVQLIPQTSAITFKAITTNQYRLAGSDGYTWRDMDTTGLRVPFTVPATGYDRAVVTANADLWTANTGFNQDIGVTLSGGAYPSTTGQPESWKESGGFAGTFSPNAAFVEAALPVAAGASYTVTLQWKANQSDPGSIYAGAGPIGGKFSPTVLTVILFANPPPNAIDFSFFQSFQINSDGAYWSPLGDMSLQTYFTPATDGAYMFSANMDLFTQQAGFNQDMGIQVAGGAYGANGTLVAWKESGGFAGTFSPNAAYASAPLLLKGGVQYTFQIVWKTNRISDVYTEINGGAGPIGFHYSTTWLTAVPLG
jgi:Fibronectin type III domain